MYLDRRDERPGRQAGAGRRRRRRDHAGARRRPRSRRTEARHARRHARQSQSRRLGQAGPHHGRHDAGRRDSSVLCGESPDAHADAGREPRGSLGARRALRSARRSGPWRAGRSRRKAAPLRRSCSPMGICYAEPAPVLSVLDELRTIEVGERRGRDAVRQHGRPCRRASSI